MSVAIASCAGNTASTSSSPNSASPVANSAKEVELTLVGYAAPEAAHDAIIPKFIEKWQKEKGQPVTIRKSE